MGLDARWHARLKRPLPQPGLLKIHLVTRRRALLNRLVDWAERMGYPWRTRIEPTPADVRGTAARQDMPQVERWAESIEGAAFGPEAVDEARENEIRGQEPHWERSRHTSR